MKQKHIDPGLLTTLVRDLLACAVTDDYAEKIVGLDKFMERVREDIEEASAWADEGFYGLSDVKMAVGRIILDIMKWELT